MRNLVQRFWVCIVPLQLLGRIRPATRDEAGPEAGPALRVLTLTETARAVARRYRAPRLPLAL